MTLTRTEYRIVETGKAPDTVTYSTLTHAQHVERYISTSPYGTRVECTIEQREVTPWRTVHS